jgi:nitrate reductase molybdenum cofactor assembly chaperone NarJ/NarW
VKTFKVLGLLLTYPEQEWLDAMSEMAAVLREEALLPSERLQPFEDLMVALRSTDVYTSQENYVALFDRSRSLSLHLFEHVHGDSRDRGQAMVDLKRVYAERGLYFSANELPDFLPVFLEYLSVLPFEEAQAQLDDTVHILAGLGARLKKRGSPYHAVFAALLHLGAAPKSAIHAAETAPEPKEEDLDEAWEDKPVTFGGASPQKQVINFVRRAV